jgi:hypothetical protein
MWRFAEHTAIGLLLSCAIGAVIVALAWWRDLDAMAAVGAIMLIGVAAGAVASIWRRITLLETASLIESQLQLPELFSTALLSDRSEFADAVRAMADARLTHVTLSSLVLRRFGPRTFIGAGLAGTCLLVIATMISSPAIQRPLLANVPTGAAVDRWVSQTALTAEHLASLSSDPRSRPVQRDPDSRSSDLQTDPMSSTQLLHGRLSDQRMTSSNASGSGSGAARSESNLAVASDASHRVSDHTIAGTLAAGGSGDAMAPGESGMNTGGTMSTSSSEIIPPWQTSGWAHAREAALQSVQQGGVPDPYRALVQDYFDRE